MNDAKSAEAIESIARKAPSDTKWGLSCPVDEPNPAQLHDWCE
jgi:hypothetical protein